MSLLGLPRRESRWKDAEILILHHQLAVAQRELPRAHSRLRWPDRARLALLAGTRPIERLAAMRLIVTPGTILRWHRDIVRRRWRGGRARAVPAGRRCAATSGRWCSGWRGRTSRGGNRRIHGELAGLGIIVAPSTVWQMLKNAGIDPAPRLDGPGLDGVPAIAGAGDPDADFFTADLLNGSKVHVLAAIEHGTRRIRIIGTAEHPA